MTSDQLAYWLQGAFEIAEIKAIHEGQAACILRHIALVRVLEPASPLCAKVEALLAVRDPEERASLVRAAVAAEFEHVIDPKHPKPKAANAAHHGNTWVSGNGPILYRC